ERRKKNRPKGDERTEHPVRRRAHERPQVSGEREQRTRHGLCRSISGHELRLADPGGENDLAMQEREHDVAAAEHHRPYPVKALHERQPVNREERAQDRKAGKEREKEGEAEYRNTPWYVKGEVVSADLVPRREKQPAG